MRRFGSQNINAFPALQAATDAGASGPEARRGTVDLPPGDALQPGDVVDVKVEAVAGTAVSDPTEAAVTLGQ